jgi:hypothetical protein
VATVVGGYNLYKLRRQVWLKFARVLIPHAPLLEVFVVNDGQRELYIEAVLFGTHHRWQIWRGSEWSNIGPRAQHEGDTEVPGVVSVGRSGRLTFTAEELDFYQREEHGGQWIAVQGGTRTYKRKLPKAFLTKPSNGESA